MKVDKNHLHFHTGRRVFAYGGCVSINAIGELVEGSVGVLRSEIPGSIQGPLSQAERMELAAFMISRWEKIGQTTNERKGHGI